MELIIGASGYVGKNILEYFFKSKKKSIGTFYSSPRENLVYFDLSNPRLDSLNMDLSQINHAIICSGITKPDECKINEEKAHEINVSGTRNLIEQLWEKNILPIWFSSEYVFNGHKGNYTEDDKLCPNTVYGEHKSLIENFLGQSKKDSLVLRLGKVFSLNPNEETILTTIIKKLKNNEIIRSAKDQIFSPIYIQDLCRIIDASITKNLRGLYNVASQEYFSRYYIANLIKEKLKIKTGKILPCSIRDLQFIDNRPLNTSLNPEKIIKEIGFKFTPLETCISKLEKIVK